MIENLKLDDQNFEQLVGTARKAIRKYAPEWTDENVHDPGITLIELFAWLTEMLSYYMNHTTEQLNFAFLSLLGYPRSFGSPAVCFCSDVSPVVGFIRAGTKFYKGDFCFETVVDTRQTPYEIIDVKGYGVGEAARDLLTPMRNGLSVYPFGRIAEKRHEPSFELHFDREIDASEGIRLYFKVVEDGFKRNPVTDPDSFILLGQLTWYTLSDDVWLAAETVDDATYGLLQSGILTVKSASNHISGLRAVLEDDQYELMPKIAFIATHVIELVQTETLSEADYTSMWHGSGLPNQRIPLPFPDVFMHALQLEVLEQGEWQPWHFVPTLYAGNGEDRIYTVDFDARELYFGDGVYGKVPEIGHNNIRLVSVVRSALAQGNIMLDQLSASDGDIVLKALTPAYGGKAVDTLEMLKDQMFEDREHHHLAVTAADYEHIVKEAQGLMIERVKCLPMYRPGLKHYPAAISENTVSVLVVPHGIGDIRTLNSAYIQNIHQLLSRKKMLTTEIYVINPVYYELTLHFEGSLNVDCATAVAQIRIALEKAGVLDFGKPVLVSAFYQVLMQMDAIDSIDYLNVTCRQTVRTNKRGDIFLPPDGIGLITAIELNTV
jgi:hypothetical protein